MEQRRRWLPAGADERLQQAAGQCALCAVGCLLVKNMANLLGRALLAVWMNGPGVGAAAPVWEQAQWTLSLAAGFLSLAIPVWAVRNRPDVRPAAALWCRPRTRVLWWAAPVYLAAAQLGNGLAGAVGRMTGSSQSVELPQGAAALLAAFAALCLVPAVLEEWLFRGVMQGLLRPYGAAVAIVGQAVLFALLHGSLSGIVFALPAGLFFGLLAEQSGSLVPGAALHFVNNVLAFVLLWLQSNAYEALAQGLGVMGLLVFPLWAAVTLAGALLRRKRVPHRPGPGVSPLELLRCPAWVITAAALLVAALAGAAR